MQQSSDIRSSAEPETTAADDGLLPLSADKSRFYRRRAKRKARVSRRSIDLACEEFFRSRGMPAALPFCRITERASKGPKDEQQKA